jgi:hypothetical protein
MRYRLRTLLILLGVLPPLLAGIWFLASAASRNPLGAIFIGLGILSTLPLWPPIVFAGYSVRQKSINAIPLACMLTAEAVALVMWYFVFGLPE